VIYRAAVTHEATSLAPGQICAVTNDAIHAAAGQGVLAITELQPANGRRMSVGQYLAGHPIQVGMSLNQSADL